MSKRNIIILGVVIFLGLLIFLKKAVNFDGLPSIEKWEGDVDEISIIKPGGTIRFFKENNNWVINNEKFKADKSAVDLLAKNLNELKLLDLISKRKIYTRFDLDKDKAVQVIVKKNNKELRNILLGKKNNTGRQVFMKFNSKPEVYTAPDIILNQVNQDIDRFRDKKIMSIATDAIKSLSAKYKGKSFVIKSRKKIVKLDSPKDSKEEAKTQERVEWFAQNGSLETQLNNKKVKTFVSVFNSIVANKFEGKSDSTKKSLASYEISAFNKKFTFDVLIKNKDNTYICRSSESDYDFVLSAWKVEKLLVGLKDLK